MTSRCFTFWPYAVFLAFLLFPGCAGELATTSRRSLSSADSLAATGDYLHAKRAYNRILQSRPNTSLAEDAQYQLGYLSIFYENPFADWEVALAEFKKYKEKYPMGRHIDKVNTWLSVLHALQSYNAGYHTQVDQAEKLISKRSTEKRRIVGLADSVLRCEHERDSLRRALYGLENKLREYEELILRLQ